MQLTFEYPVNPGWKGTQTSKDAAEEKKSTKAKDQQCVLDTLAAHQNGLTADEIANLHGEIYTKYRPRCSELKKLGKITSSGERRPSYLGTHQDVLRLK